MKNLPVNRDMGDTKAIQGIHDEFVLVIQGASSLYRFGSDRVANAEHFCRKHCASLLGFNSSELHPDTNRMWRNRANAYYEQE